MNHRRHARRRLPLVIRLAALTSALACALADDAGAVPSGTLDATFGSGGIVKHAVGTGADQSFALALGSDGAIVVAGYGVEQRQKMAVSRFDATGTAADGFGDDGDVLLAVATTRDRAHAVLVQDDDKLVLAGFSRIAGRDAFAVARLLPGGSPDPGFGSGGLTTTQVGSGDAQIQAAALDGEGRIVVAGWARVGANRDVALARYLTNGAPDPTFGTAGTVTHALGTSNDEAWAVAVQPDGKIVLAGFSANGSQQEMLVARLTDTGALDPSFNSTGSHRIDFGSGNGAARGVVLQPDGAIVVAGYARAGTVDHVAVARVAANGTLDPTFDGDGLVMRAVGNSSEAHAVALQPRGRIVVAGATKTSNNSDFAILQLRPDGSPDPTFGNAGVVVLPIGTHNDEANAVAVDEDGSIVAAGTARTGTNDVTADFAVVRLIVNRCGDGFVDPEESCDSVVAGTGDCCSTSCTLVTAGTECRAVAGGCDVAESCDGASPDCPVDEWLDAGVVCRGAAGMCDVQESCDGLGPQCPPDAKVPALTVCRAATDDCDAVEHCNGSSVDCPADKLSAAGTVCRPGTDLCDAAETCTGTSAECPVDVLSPAGTVCRGSAAACDVAEACDGLVATCPADAFAEAGTPCRGVASACDVAESCSGDAATCPTDVGLPDGDGDGVCDVEDVCPATPDPGQADGDGDGLGDACDPCTNGLPFAKTVLRIANFLTPPGDDKIKIKANLKWDATPALDPAVTGVRIRIEGPDGTPLYDLSVPPGERWRTNGNGSAMIYRNPTPVGALVNHVKIIARRSRPGFVQLRINGHTGSFAQTPLPAPLRLTVSIDPTRPDVCGETTFAAASPAPACNMVEEGLAQVCR